MQPPTTEVACPSSSVGVEWMGPESSMLDVLESESSTSDATVKRVAKESIVVWVWKRCVGREMV